MKKCQFIGIISVLVIFCFSVLSAYGATSSIKDWSQIAKDAKSSVVKIVNDLGSKTHKLGSGFYINDFTVITNYHVVKDAPLIDEDNGMVRVYPFGAEGGSDYPGYVSLVNEASDIAIILVPDFKGHVLPMNHNPIPGKPVLAIGTPEGFEYSLTSGIISAIRSDGNFIYIQTDASLNPGNSGGPLIDSEGKVVGVNTFQLNSAQNMNFAVSIKSIIELAQNSNLPHLIKKFQELEPEDTKILKTKKIDTATEVVDTGKNEKKQVQPKSEVEAENDFPYFQVILGFLIFSFFLIIGLYKYMKSK